MKRVTRLVAKMQPKRTVLRSGLRGADAKLGFKLSQVGPPGKYFQSLNALMPGTSGNFLKRDKKKNFRVKNSNI